MSSVSVGSLQADPSSERPDTTIGNLKDIRSANRLSSLFDGVLIVDNTVMGLGYQVPGVGFQVSTAAPDT